MSLIIITVLINVLDQPKMKRLHAEMLIDLILNQSITKVGVM